MRLIDADRLLDRCIFYHLPNGDLAVPIINVQHAPTVKAPDINVRNIDTTTHDSIPAENGLNDADKTSGDCISRQKMLEKIRTMQTYKLFSGDDMILIDKAEVQTELMMLPSAEPKRKKMTNKEWVDFLSEQFTVSRTSAREMLHGLMRWKAEDNFKKQFSGGRNESRRM